MVHSWQFITCELPACYPAQRSLHNASRALTGLRRACLHYDQPVKCVMAKA
ncbi:hypothetical protein CKS_3127 [Pantoea stewartii subsp. stewartii DC283]|uniref:Uncharacterized protein n=1 Tax=Pantoea stewartii subsp. stewartii DC283 TaxID=660596 RepID=H3RKC5_PANSE|nr:hypothetical protein CKS_3127 [Pantoea stewartii subsp. stewartii DC283]